MENNYCVYCHTNKLTGEKYIGASKNIKKRWCANGINYIKYGKFGEAIRKYGWNNFDHEIIKNNLSKAEAEDYEKMYIAELNTIEEGYNIQSGGNLFDGMSGEKNPFYNDHRFKGSSHPFYGKHHTYQSRKRMSENHWDCSGVKNPFYNDHRFTGINSVVRKPVKCLETGKIYITISDAERDTGIPRQNIRKQINGKISHAGGYHWADVPK